MYTCSLHARLPGLHGYVRIIELTQSCPNRINAHEMRKLLHVHMSSVSRSLSRVSSVSHLNSHLWLVSHSFTRVVRVSLTFTPVARVSLTFTRVARVSLTVTRVARVSLIFTRVARVSLTFTRVVRVQQPTPSVHAGHVVQHRPVCPRIALVAHG